MRINDVKADSNRTAWQGTIQNSYPLTIGIFGNLRFNGPYSLLTQVSEKLLPT